jgi:hypothetical protein
MSYPVKTKTLEIIVHCIADQLPVFASMLTAELSSLWHHPPKCSVKVTVVASPRDVVTRAVCEDFSSLFYNERDVMITAMPLADEMLYRKQRRCRIFCRCGLHLGQRVSGRYRQPGFHQGTDALSAQRHDPQVAR